MTIKTNEDLRRYAIFPIEETERIMHTAMKLGNCPIKDEYLSNIHNINKLYLGLSSCSQYLISQVKARLNTGKIGIHNRLNDYLVALVWFSLSEQDKQIADSVFLLNEQYELISKFWNKLVRVTEVESLSYKVKLYQYCDPENITREKRRKLSRERSLYLNRIVEHEDDDESVSYSIVTDKSINKIPAPDEYKEIVKTTHYTSILFKESFLKEIEEKVALVENENDNTRNINSIYKLLKKMNDKPLIDEFSKDFLTVEETAHYLGVSVKTIHYYSSKKILNAYTLNGKKKYYKKDEIIQKMEQNKISNQKELTMRSESILRN